MCLRIRVYMYIYIYTYIDRERERQRGKEKGPSAKPYPKPQTQTALNPKPTLNPRHKPKPKPFCEIRRPYTGSPNGRVVGSSARTPKQRLNPNPKTPNTRKPLIETLTATLTPLGHRPVSAAARLAAAGSRFLLPCFARHGWRDA